LAKCEKHILTLLEVEDEDSTGGRLPAGTIEAGAIRGESSLQASTPYAVVCNANVILMGHATDVKLAENHESRRL
jgi:hypothetical protein